MRVENTEKELQLKLNAIKKIMSKDIYGSKQENEHVKSIIEGGHTDIKNLFGDSGDLKDLCAMSSFAMDLFRRIDFLHEVEAATGITVKDFTKEAFFTIFSEKRVKALINILQPINAKVYQKEGALSLQCNKNEIAKGFSEEEINKEGIVEISTKFIFWINKLTKLSSFMEIYKLKARPITHSSDDNYYSAQQRSNILTQFEDLCAEDKEILKSEIVVDYEKAFGVKIEDDMETLKDIKSMKKLLYSLKNTLMTDLLIRYFDSVKKGKELQGVQAMGVELNEKKAEYGLGNYIATVRLKGYTSNIYFHIPSFCFEEAISMAKIDKLSVIIPKKVYSRRDPNKLVPVNVIYKVEKGSKRYEAIKKEAEENRDNEVLKQAFIQVKGKSIPGHSKADWKRKTIEIDNTQK